MSFQKTQNSGLMSSLELTFDVPTLPSQRISTDTHLKAQKLGDIVLQFSKKGSQKRNQKRRQQFSNISSNSQELNSDSSQGYARSMEEQGFQYQHQVNGQAKNLISQLLKPYPYSTCNKELSYRKGFQQNLHSNGDIIFHKQVSGYSTLARSNRCETRDNSQHQPRKSEHFLTSIQLGKQFGCHHRSVEIVDIDESFQIAGSQESHCYGEQRPTTQSTCIILEESAINPINEQLKQKLQSFLNSNSKTQAKTQTQTISCRTILKQNLAKSQPQTKTKLLLKKLVNNHNLVQDRTTKIVMEEEIVDHYFCSTKRYKQIYWQTLLGEHPTIRKLYGLERCINDLKLFWEPFPEEPKNLKQMLVEKKLNKDLIPGIIRQILSLICHFRKHDILHGDLLPENILCLSSQNEQYVIKIKSLESCTQYTQRDMNRSLRTARYYPSQYQRNSFLVPDLMALCLLTFQLYTGIQPTIDDMMTKLNKEICPEEWSSLPEKAFDFIKQILSIIKNSYHSQNLESVLIHQFVWGCLVP